MEIDEARRDDELAAVDARGVRRARLRRREPPVRDREVADRILAARRVDDARSGDGQRGGRIGQPAEGAGRSSRHRVADESQHRHAHRDAVLDLAPDEAARAVGDLRAELHALVRRPGVEEDGAAVGHARAVRW